jgi:hypothetical protein
MIKLTEQQVIDQVADRLTHLYAEVDPGQVSRRVHEEYHRFQDRPIRDFIPLFVERNVKTELSKLGA